MRVIAGEARGRRILVPRGLAVRPSGARLRESAFGILEHRGAIRASRVLDLFAGSGVLGIEALSRGATSALAMERSPEAAQMIAENARYCGFSDRHQVARGDVETLLNELPAGDAFDLVFLDPPYGKADIDAVLGILSTRKLIGRGGVVLIEHPHGDAPGEVGDLQLDLTRRYGGSAISLFLYGSPD